MSKELKSPENGVRTIFSFLGGCLMALPLLDVQLLPRAATGILVILASALIFPHVTLTEEGVRVRRLFRSRLYSWTALQQVGIYETISKKLRDVTVRSYTFVLVLPGGICKEDGMPFETDQDRRYFLQLPVNPEIRTFIETYYGPLDFDEEKLSPSVQN